MIIDFRHSFKDYDEILNFYGIWDYECPNPKCGAKTHPMRRHAKYERNLVLWSADSCQLRDERMEILRLKCCSCGTTHAVLTVDIIPFFAYSIQAFLALISLCMKPEGSIPKTEWETGVSYQLLYRFLLLFHEYAGKLAFFLRCEELWDGTGHPHGRQMLPLLFVNPPPWLASGVFRQEHSPFSSTGTAASPIRFCLEQFSDLRPPT